MKHKRITVIMLAAAMVLTACGAKSPAVAFPGTADKDMVTLDVTSEPLDLNPMMLSDTIAQSVLAHCMSGMTRLDANDNPVADLAESWEINEDNTEYIMHLRKDAKWSNGDPVTAHDYYYSWVTQMTPATGTIYAAFLYKNIKNGEAFYNGEAGEEELGLEVIDDYTLKIQWSHPVTYGLFYLSQPFYLPMNQKAYEEIGADKYAKEADQMVTNGAYKITEWVHNDHITLEKSEDYFDAKEIQIPKVKLVMIGDANTRINAFTAGEVDMCSLYSEQIAQIKEKDETVLQAYVDGGSWYLDFNTRDPYLSNVNLRKALAYSIDVQSLLDNVIADGSVAADGFVPTTIAGINGETYAKARGSLFSYDKEAAKQYLDQALTELGIEKSQLKLTFWGTDTTYNKNQAAYLQQQWKTNLDLDVALKSTAGKALTEAEMNGDYQMTVGGTGPSENDAITFLENYVSDSMSNYGKYTNDEYDRLITASIGEGDPAKRQELLIAAEKLLIEDMVVGPMYFTCTAYVVSGKLKGMVRTPFQFFSVRDASIATD